MVDKFKRIPEQDREEELSIGTFPELAWQNLETSTVLFTDAGVDPNQAVWHDRLFLLFTDQAEYYAVCAGCRSKYGEMQWSGSTRGGPNWRRRADEYLAWRLKERGWCEFCDKIFGNGGWI